MLPRILFVLTLLGVCAAPVPGQETAPATTQATQPAEPPPAEAPTELTVEAVDARISQTQSATDLPETIKAELLGLYRQAKDQVQLAQSWTAKLDEFRRGREAAPEMLERARAELAERPTTQPAAEANADLSVEQLTQRLTQAEADLRSRREEEDRLSDEANNRAERRRTIPDLLAAANARLERVRQELAAGPPPGSSPQVGVAYRMLRQAQKKAVEQEIATYNEELRYYDARSQLLAARRELARLQVLEQQAVVQDLQHYVSERRQAEIRRQQEQAEAELRRAPRPVRELAETNREFVKERDRVAGQIDATRAVLADTKRRMDEIDGLYRSLSDRLDQPALGEAYFGLVMRRARESLSTLAPQPHELVEMRRAYDAVGPRLYEIESERLALANLDQRVADRMAEIESSTTRADLDRVRARLRDLLQTQAELLDSLKVDYDTLYSSMSTALADQSKLAQKAGVVRGFIEERELWIRSAGVMHRQELPAALQSVPAYLVAVGRGLLVDATRVPAWYLAVLVVVAGLLLVNPALRRQMLEIGKRTQRVYSDSFVLTLRALAVTILLAVPWPVVWWFLGWRAETLSTGLPAGTDEFARALGMALRDAAIVLLMLSFVRRLCRGKGVAEAHFRWAQESVRFARQNVIWLTYFVFAATIIVATAEHHPDIAWRDSIGRLAFLVSMVAFATFLARVMHPGRGILAQRLKANPDGWLFHSRWIWYGLLVLVPLALAGMSYVGYHYTALKLAGRLFLTAEIVFGLIFLHALATRWLLLEQRKLAIQQAERRRKAERDRLGDSAHVTPEAPLEDEASVSLVSIGDQTRKLLRSVVAFGLVLAMWFVWADMLPALSFMEDVELWSYTVEHAAADGEAPTTELIRITLEHVALAILVTVATAVLARNIPGLLEITLLKSLPIDTGGRYAVTALARYVIVVVGVVVAFGAVGIRWTQVQWLVTAMLVGLGFGLQEIFANFVSGLILLFERPIRVGDTVTIDNISGTVTKIRIRATTITDWDRKELVIPNREFVTGRVVNWTLTDQVLRLVIRVGVAYGSDTEKARDLMVELTKSCKRVLPDPRPKALFMGFGDSALNLELRAYVKDVDDWILACNELHTKIHDAFKDAGIEIAFPQRDLHIRTINGLPFMVPPSAADRPESDTEAAVLRGAAEETRGAPPAPVHSGRFDER